MTRPKDSIILSRFSNLSRFTFIGHCIDTEDRSASMVKHLLNILTTIQPGTNTIKLIEIRFDLILDNIITDDLSQVHPEFSELPFFFRHAEWTEINTLVARLSDGTDLHVDCDVWGIDDHGFWTRIIPPVTFADIVNQWVSDMRSLE